MLILTQHLKNDDTPFPAVREHFVEAERIRFFEETDGTTTVITHDGSALFHIQENPMTIARMCEAWARRHTTKAVEDDGDLLIAIRATEDGDCRFIGCIHNAARIMASKVKATREMADDLTDRAEQAQALATEAEAALSQALKP